MYTIKKMTMLTLLMVCMFDVQVQAYGIAEQVEEVVLSLIFALGIYGSYRLIFSDTSEHDSPKKPTTDLQKQVEKTPAADSVGNSESAARREFPEVFVKKESFRGVVPAESDKKTGLQSLQDNSLDRERIMDVAIEAPYI
jgi:hypothetical protein